MILMVIIYFGGESSMQIGDDVGDEHMYVNVDIDGDDFVE